MQTEMTDQKPQVNERGIESKRFEVTYQDEDYEDQD